MLYLPVLNIFLGYYKLTKLITTLRLRLRAGPGAGAGSSALPWRHMRFQHCQLPLLGLAKKTERGKEEAGLAWPGPPHRLVQMLCHSNLAPSTAVFVMEL